MTYREFLIGCGHARDKRLKAPSRMVKPSRILK